MRAFKHYIVLLLLALAGGQGLQSQQPADFVLSKTIHGDIVDFNTDNLGNIYVITKDNLLEKLDANGDSIAVFNDVRHFGKIWTIDVTNPLKILVFYREFATIVVLD